MGYKGGNAGIVHIKIKRQSDANFAYATADDGTSGQNLDLYDSTEQYSIPVFTQTGLDWDTWVVRVEMTGTKNASANAYEFWLDFALVKTRIYAQAWNVVIYGATGSIYADTIIKDALTSACPDIDSDQDGVGSPAVALDSAVFEQNYRPSEIVERLAPIGDALNQMWDFAIWEDWKPHFSARPSSYTHQVQLDDIEFEQANDLQGLYNKVAAEYQDDRGNTVRTAWAEDTDSQSDYGLTREFIIPTGRTGDTQAQQIRDAQLELWKTLPSTSRIVIRGNLYDEDGKPVPIEEFRAGSVLRVNGLKPWKGMAGTVDNETVFYCKQVEFDADSWTLTVTPGDPVESVETLITTPGKAGGYVSIAPVTL
jgi:hypothetical protein